MKTKRIYHIVLMSISNSNTKNHIAINRILSVNELNNLLDLMGRQLDIVCKAFDSSECLGKSTNKCLNLNYDIFGEAIYMHDILIVDYLFKFNRSKCVYSTHTDFYFAKFLNKSIGHYIGKQNLLLVQELLSSDGRLWTLKFNFNPLVYHIFVLFYILL